MAIGYRQYYPDTNLASNSLVPDYTAWGGYQRGGRRREQDPYSAWWAGRPPAGERYPGYEPSGEPVPEQTGWGYGEGSTGQEIPPWKGEGYPPERGREPVVPEQITGGRPPIVINIGGGGDVAEESKGGGGRGGGGGYDDYGDDYTEPGPSPTPRTPNYWENWQAPPRHQNPAFQWLAQNLGGLGLGYGPEWRQHMRSRQVADPLFAQRELSNMLNRAQVGFQSRPEDLYRTALMYGWQPTREQVSDPMAYALMNPNVGYGSSWGNYRDPLEFQQRGSQLYGRDFRTSYLNWSRGRGNQFPWATPEGRNEFDPIRHFADQPL